MKRWLAGGALAVLLAGGGWLFMSGVVGKKPGPDPKVAAREMKFPQGVEDMLGDEQGRMCHQVIVRLPGEPDRIGAHHFIEGKDFRKGSREEKMAWLKEHLEKDMESSGLACNTGPGDWFLGASAAYGQIECNPAECGGGYNCSTWSCPARLSIPHQNCSLGGPNCVITYFCCGAGCTPTCNP
jgi:hypothetical protein